MMNLTRVTLLTLALLGVRAHAADPSSAPSTRADSRTIHLRLGEARFLFVTDMKHVEVGNPMVADITSTGANNLRIEARQPGVTTLTVYSGVRGHQVYRLQVED